MRFENKLESAYMIDLIKIQRTYRIGAQTIHALNEVDLHIAEGEFVPIMGRSERL